MSIQSNIKSIENQLPGSVTLVAVSKMQPESAILEACQGGQLVFGESRPQELVAKYNALPKDIRWHMIGHLQTNKVKMIAPFVTMIQSVDSQRLLEAINSAALNNGRKIEVLLEVRIAAEQTKSGWQFDELVSFLDSCEWREMEGILFRGVMGIATYTDDRAQIKQEFDCLRDYSVRLRESYFDDRFDVVSMGMSGDWPLAVECGSTMIRVGGAIFGKRE